MKSEKVNWIFFTSRELGLLRELSELCGMQSERWNTVNEIKRRFHETTDPVNGAGPVVYAENGRKYSDDSESHIAVIGRTGKGDGGTALKKNAKGMEGSQVHALAEVSNPGTGMFIEKIDTLGKLCNHTSCICVDRDNLYLMAS